MRRTLVRALVLLSLFALAWSVSTATTVTGKVLGSDGKPVAGAMLYYSKTPFDVPVQVDGSFTFETDLPQFYTIYSNLVAYAPGYTLTRPDMDYYSPLITINPATELHGIVVDATGKPVGGVPVRLESVQTGQQPCYVPEAMRSRFTVISRADGTWTLPGVPLYGSVTVMLDDDRFVREQQQVKVTPEAKPALRFTLQPGATLSGHLLDAQGAPIGETIVTAYASGSYGLATTAVDGSYHIAGLAAGQYSLYARDPNSKWLVDTLKNITVAAGTETVAPDMHAYAGAMLEGMVVDADTGAIISNVDFALSTIKDQAPESFWLNLQTDKAGHYTSQLRAIHTKVFISRPPAGYLRQQASDAIPVDLQEGKTVTVTFRLHKGMAISGKVIDADGKPAVGVPLAITMLAGTNEKWSPNSIYMHVISDAEGKFIADGLPVGKGTLELIGQYIKGDEWVMPAPLAIEVPSKGPITVTVTHTPLRTVTGRVLDPKQQPLAGVMVSYSVRLNIGLDPKVMTLVTDADGRYTLPGIPSGVTPQLLSLEKPGYRQRLNATQRNEQGIPATDFVMVACDATMRGKVCDANGKPVSGATVVSAEGGLHARAMTDAAGAFTLTAQPNDGALHLIAATPDGGGVAMSTGNATDAVITCIPSRVAKPTDLQLAQDLLDADSKLAKAQRHFNRFDVIHDIADYDLPLAMQLAQNGGEPAPEGLRAYLLGKLAQQSPAKAAKIGKSALDQITDDKCRLYAAAELGIGVVKSDPALAEYCYTVAKAISDRMQPSANFSYIEGMGVVQDVTIRVGPLILAQLLQKTADVDAMLKQFSAEAKDAGGMSYMITQPLMQAAGRVDADFVLKVFDRIKDAPFTDSVMNEAMTSMLKHNIAGVQQLMEKTAPEPNSVNPMRRENILQMIRILGKTDPAAALALAKAQNDNRTAALLEAAAFLPKDEAKTLVLGLFAKQNNRTLDYVAKVSTFDLELGKTLYTQYKVNLDAENNTFSYAESPISDRLKYAYLIGSLDPVEARLMLEMDYAVTQSMTGNEKYYGMQVALAMYAVDVLRAQAMADAVDVNDDYRGYFRLAAMRYILWPNEKRLSEIHF